MTVRSRLLAGFGVAVAILVLPALFAADRLAELQDLAIEGRARQTEALVGLGRMQGALSDLDRFGRSYVATGDEALARSAEEALAVLLREHDALVAPPYAQAVEALTPLVAEVDRLVAEIRTEMNAVRIAAATESFVQLERTLGEAERTLIAVTDEINATAQRGLEQAGTLSAESRRETLIGTGLALLVALLVATWASGTLTGPLRRLGDAMARVADGDFEPPTDLHGDRRDEIGTLTQSFQVMSRRLADLNRMKAEFIGVASHEIKTPINAIHGYAELIQEEFGDEAPEEYRRMVDGIAEQAIVLARLVDRLMDLSRLETGSYRVQIEKVHVRDLLTGVLRGFEIMARQRAVTLTATVREGAPETADMDLDLVRDEVLGNLVSNALQHTPAGGRVELEVHAAPSGIAFTVTDTGPGVPPAERELVFRKYYRGNSGKPGTGLGLAIARETVLLHGGSIGMEDAPEGSGARVRVFLPRAMDGLGSHPPEGETKSAPGAA